MTHGQPSAGMECLATMDDITSENYCEYKTEPSGTWHPSLFSKPVVVELQNTQFVQYMEAVQKPDCKAELRRLLKTGPPTFIYDKHALALPEGDTHISTLWFMDSDTEVSALLVDAKEGEQRIKLWEELKQMTFEDLED